MYISNRYYVLDLLALGSAALTPFSVSNSDKIKTLNFSLINEPFTASGKDTH